MSLNVTFLGHSGFVFDDGKHRVAVDPFLTGNPVAASIPAEIEVDAIALTNGHADHVGDTVEIAKRCDCPVIAAFELCNILQGKGLEKLEPGNPGGRVYTDFGYVAFTQAFHSSSYEGQYAGLPCGLVLRFSDAGATVYHTGDTSLFSDMQLIGELAQPDIMCVCMGDRFTMDARLATIATEMVNPRVAIPIHYKTWPLLAQTIDGFEPQDIEVREMQPGQTWTWQG